MYGTFTLFGRPSQKAFHYAAGFSTSRDPVQSLQTDPTTPSTQRCTSITCDGFGLLPVRSPLLGESRLISSPPGTEMVQFPGCAFRTLWIQMRMTGIHPVGLPHSAIRGSRDVCSSPRLIAAYHGLLRTAAPRHPPWTLSRLTILSFALQPGFHAFQRRLHPRDSPQKLVPQAPQRPPEASYHSEKAPAAPSTSAPGRHGRSRRSRVICLSGSRLRALSSPFPCTVKDHVRWRYGDLNPRPMACKATALATELYPQV